MESAHTASLMPRYSCELVLPSGDRVRMEREAASSTELAEVCSREGASLIHFDVSRRSRTRRGPRHSVELADMLSSLGSLLGVGLSVPDAVAETAALVRGPAASTLRDVGERVARGEALSVAMAQHSDWYGGVVTGAVAIGERTGDLAGALERVGHQVRRDADVRSELAGSLIYPAMLTVAGGAAVLVLLTVVLPRFETLIRASGGVIPPLTALVLAVSAWATEWGPIVGGLLLLALVTGTAVPSRRREEWLARSMAAIPGVRLMRRQLLTARYARMLGTLLGGGAPLSEALRMSSTALQDPLARNAAQGISDEVQSGGRLSDALKRQRAFDVGLERLAAAGEGVGRLAEFMTRAADVYERRLDRTTRRAVALVEPMTVLLFGVVIGVIAMSVLQAVYGINAANW